MPNSHITDQDLEKTMSRFFKENPNATTIELAEYMFNLGYEAGEQGGLDEVNFS